MADCCCWNLGLSESRGGAISVKEGGLAELKAVTFEENFALLGALTDPSHDVMVKVWRLGHYCCI
eukprot:scaffold369448_cov34-Prasinocladus_malaysianus.AAC.1